MHTIKAITNTFLKKKTIQSSQLGDDEKVAVPEGKIYPVEEFKPAEAGHYWVKLGYEGGDWYIYDSDEDGHWDTSWEFDESEIATPVEATSTATQINNTPGSIDWSNGNLHISKYFKVAEVTLNDSRRKPKPNSAEEKNILALAQELDKIREDWGSSIIVTSWFRPSTRLGYPHDVNTQVGGAWNSQHIYGRAADIKPAQGSIFNFQSWLDAHWYGALGYGAQKGFVHLDTRNGLGWKTGGTKSVRWNY